MRVLRVVTWPVRYALMYLAFLAVFGAFLWLASEAIRLIVSFFP